MSTKQFITSLLKKPLSDGRSWRWNYAVFKWVIMIAAYLFLVYKLIAFKQYGELFEKWNQMPLSQFWWLLAVVILFPLNYFFEAVKWEMLVSKVQKISFVTSLKAVLAGISTGFFTPNRVGELVGRVMFLDVENRKSGVTFSVVNSLTQNLIMALCGIPTCLAFYYFTAGSLNADIASYLLILISFLLFFGIFYFALPQLSQRLASSSISAKIGTFTSCLSAYGKRDLVQIMVISLLRYIIFCIQFFLMLRFFSVHLNVWEAIFSIPTSYLFVTFTPSIAFSEPAIRSSYAVLFIGAFSGQVVGIALAGVCIWVINFVFPMLVGSVVMLREPIGLSTQQED